MLPAARRSSTRPGATGEVDSWKRPFHREHDSVLPSWIGTALPEAFSRHKARVPWIITSIDIWWVREYMAGRDGYLRVGLSADKRRKANASDALSFKR